MHITDINDKGNRLLSCERKIDTLTKSLSLLIDRVNFLQGQVTDSKLEPSEPYYKEVLFAFQELKKTIEVTLPEAITNRLLEDFESRLDDVRQECLHINQLSIQEIKKEDTGMIQGTHTGKDEKVEAEQKYRQRQKVQRNFNHEIALWLSLKEQDKKFFAAMDKLPFNDPIKDLSIKQLVILYYVVKRTRIKDIMKITTFSFSRWSVAHVIKDVFPRIFRVSGINEIADAWNERINRASGDN